MASLSACSRRLKLHAMGHCADRNIDNRASEAESAYSRHSLIPGNSRAGDPWLCRCFHLSSPHLECSGGMEGKLAVDRNDIHRQVP
eukprot:124255-Amphidinium_carterae.2